MTHQIVHMMRKELKKENFVEAVDELKTEGKQEKQLDEYFFQKEFLEKKNVSNSTLKARNFFLTISFFGIFNKTDMDLINNIYIFKTTCLTPFSL